MTGSGIYKVQTQQLFLFSSRMKMITEPMTARNPKQRKRTQATNHPATESMYLKHVTCVLLYVCNLLLGFLTLSQNVPFSKYILYICIHITYTKQWGLLLLANRDGKHLRFSHFFLCSFFGGVRGEYGKKVKLYNFLAR